MEEDPISDLYHEHKIILKVVHALVVFEKCLTLDQKVDVGTIKKVIDFMRNFADRCHHAKEEAVLFPAMEQKGVPRTGCPLGGLRSEHDHGRNLVLQVENALFEYENGKYEAVVKMTDAFGEIRKLYTSHIWKEDEMVFPMAKRLFQKDDMDRLRRGFEEAEKEYGEHHDEYVLFAEKMDELLRKS